MTERMELKIREMVPEDLLPLHRLLSDPEVMRYIEPPYTPKQTRAFLEDAGMTEPRRVWTVTDAEDEFLGYVIFHDYDEDSMEIGWVLRPEVRGRGIAKRLTEMLTERAFAVGKNAVIECDPEQAVTKHIAASLGFVFRGTEDGLDVYEKRRK